VLPERLLQVEELITGVEGRGGEKEGGRMSGMEGEGEGEGEAPVRRVLGLGLRVHEGGRRHL